ncbi:MAG TPA: transglycosylase SLT domain-containing protein [Pyrinomonadaceae bacterium]|nr:transglycosylase SLT domain-containing protein [Pyrinomonadaceae bacterium]HMP65849.1 transglycosylase SLT domain-containing protein [Pyrinomonadaceae bacterium]
MRLAATAILLTALFVAAYPTEGDIDKLTAIKAARSAGDLDSAITLLRSHIEKENDDKATSGLEYLLCRSLEENDDLANAMACFSSFAKNGSPLTEYALWRRSRIAWKSGNLLLEKLLLKELDLCCPDSLLRTATRSRIARGAFESGDHSLALAELGRIAPPLARAKPSTGANSRLIRLFVAKANVGLGDMEEAREQFAVLLNSGKNSELPDSIALDAVRELDVIDRGRNPASEKVAALSDGEHMKRGWVYHFNRDFRSARFHYLALIERNPLSSFAAEAVYQIGRGYSQELNFADAILWFERLVEQYPDSPPAKDGILQLASAYARVGKSRESISRYHLFIDKYPDDERLDRAYLNPVDVLRDQNSNTEALRRSKEAQEAFRGRTAEAQALFAEARTYISREEWEKAVNSIDRLMTMPDLGGVRVPGGTSRSEVTFLRGLCLEKMLRFDEAVDAYLSITDGRGEFYGWRATERLRLIAESEFGAEASATARSRLAVLADTGSQDERRRALQQMIRLTPDVEKADSLLSRLEKTYAMISDYGSPPRFHSVDEVEIADHPVKTGHATRAKMLSSLGLFDEAAPEAEAAGLATGDRLNDLYLRGDRAYRVVGSIERQWQKVPADFQVELIPAGTIRALYPAPYREALRREASARNVDPRFLLAIMRQETRFRPDAESVAGARGLMQFIPSTAERMAREARIDDFVNRDLFDPTVSIAFASIYTAEMFRMFPKQPAAVAAGYNGGEDNMQRWLKRSRSDEMDRYVAEIAYAQTKDYVFKVMANYRVYLAHYDEKLNQRPIGERARFPGQ